MGMSEHGPFIHENAHYTALGCNWLMSAQGPKTDLTAPLPDFRLPQMRYANPKKIML